MIVEYAMDKDEIWSMMDRVVNDRNGRGVALCIIINLIRERSQNDKTKALEETCAFVQSMITEVDLLIREQEYVETTYQDTIHLNLN